MSIAIATIGLVGLVYHFLPSLWDMRSRIVLAIPRKDGDVTVSVFDPQSHSIMYFSLPAETQVTASGNLGTWKLGSIWRLGIQEKKEGRLLTETIVKTFQIPTDGWADENAIGFLQGNIGQIVKAVTQIKSTNLTLKDRINLALFSLRLNPSDKYEVNLIDIGYLYPTELLDGDDGYKSRRDLPSKIGSYVSDPFITSERPTMTIKDATGQISSAAQVSRVIEALGGKVLSIEDENPEKGDCIIRAVKPITAARLAEVLGCKIVKQLPTGNFDIEIVIGEDFAKRF